VKKKLAIITGSVIAATVIAAAAGAIIAVRSIEGDLDEFFHADE
jgi:hypothetical protein